MEPKSREPITEGFMLYKEKLNFEDGSAAIWKPKKGERTESTLGSLNYPDLKAGNFYKNEAFAYDMARIVGMEDLVPEAVVRKVDGEVGAAQKWVGGREYGKMAYGDQQRFERESARDIQRAAVLDFVLNNKDRHGGNFRVEARMGGTFKLHLLDHGLAMGTKPNGRNNRILDLAKTSGSGIIPKDVKDSFINNRQVLIARAKELGIPQKSIDAMNGRIDYLMTENSYNQLRKVHSIKGGFFGF
jgi:hypothetical protein